LGDNRAWSVGEKQNHGGTQISIAALQIENVLPCGVDSFQPGSMRSDNDLQLDKKKFGFQWQPIGVRLHRE